MDTPRPLRSDAQRRRDAVLDAAGAVFGELGIEAPLEAIAERAGVGRATLYRNFPDRTSLIVAVLEREFTALDVHAQAFADDPAALFRLLDQLADTLVRTNPLGEALRRARLQPDALNGLHERIRKMFAGPVERAKAAGLARADLTADDGVLVVRMLGNALRGEATMAERSRALSLLVEGLKAHG